MKRPVEATDCGDLAGPRRKRAREVGEVAELALALAAMAEMRRGGGPSAGEREMMAAARGKLAGLCGRFSPKEVFPVEGFGAVMEDLGLDKLRERKGLGGFRPPAKLSIAEKVVYAKQKFEKTEANALRSTIQAESRGAAHTSNMLPSDRAKNLPVSSGLLHSVSPTGHASAANSTALPYQLPASEVRKSMISSGLPNPHRLDQRPNGSIYTTQMQANIPGSLAQPAWSQHTQPASLAKPGAHNKVLPQNLVKFQGTIKVEGTNHTASSRMASPAAGPRPFITQITSGNQPNMNKHVRKMNVQTSLPNNTHNEISKVVQKFLQSHLPKRPVWNPPSRDYMNKSVTCQVCKLAIVEVENVLVCDSCENGYHMKCLQTQDLKTISRGEWHCFKCLALTDGKPLPPKYGRVTRNITTQKAVPSFPEKKAEISSDQANQQKLMANGSSGIKISPASSMVNPDSASKSNAPNARGMQGTYISLSRPNGNEKSHPGSCQNEHGLKVVTTSSSPPVEISHEQKLGSELQKDTPSRPSEAVSKVLYCVPSCNGQDNDLKVSPCNEGVPSKQYSENHLAVENRETFDISKSRDDNLSVNIKQEREGVAHLELLENTDNGNHVRPSSDCSVAVDWIGDVAQVADEKTYYSSCCVNGSVYNVQDHAIFHFNKNPMPSKIQTMWEDNKTKLKWVLVNRCYFPGDLPEAVGHPCSREGNEVYESNHGCTILASLIQGPCEVLSIEKFIQESGRRSRLGSEGNVGLRPLFQCKWFYDELKGSFRDLSSLSQADMVL